MTRLSLLLEAAPYAVVHVAALDVRFGTADNHAVLFQVAAIDVLRLRPSAGDDDAGVRLAFRVEREAVHFGEADRFRLDAVGVVVVPVRTFQRLRLEADGEVLAPPVRNLAVQVLDDVVEVGFQLGERVDILVDCRREADIQVPVAHGDVLGDFDNLFLEFLRRVVEAGRQGELRVEVEVCHLRFEELDKFQFLLGGDVDVFQVGHPVDEERGKETDLRLVERSSNSSHLVMSS